MKTLPLAVLGTLAVATPLQAKKYNIESKGIDKDFKIITAHPKWAPKYTVGKKYEFNITPTKFTGPDGLSLPYERTLNGVRVYQKTKNTGGATGTAAVTIATPIQADGKIVGVTLVFGQTKFVPFSKTQVTYVLK